MEEKVENWEQPSIDEQALESTVKDKEIGATTSSEDGSLYGKFSTADELLKAYNNLQSEFTRKCQKLSEIQKQTAEKGEIETSQNDETKESSPAFESDDWRSQVAEFLTHNEKAKSFSREISNEILEDPELQKSKSMLDIAWARVLSKNYRTPAQIAKDENFMENYILSDENIKKKVLGSYLTELQKHQAPPVIGSGIKGGMSLLTKSNKPANLNDAKILVEKLFKN